MNIQQTLDGNKMKYAIHAVHNHCVEDVLMNICLKYSLPYPLMYADSWDFVYTPNMNFEVYDFGGHEYKRNIPHKEVVEKFVGLKFGEVIEKESMVHFLQKEGIDDVCIFGDTYFCYWTQGYQVHHQPHCFILNKMNENSVIVNDPYLQKSEIEIFNDTICQEKFWGVSLKYLNVQNSGYLDILSDSLKGVEYALSSLAIFIHDFERANINLKREAYIYFHPLFQNFTYIMNSRYNFSIFLYYLSQKNSDYMLYHKALEFYEIAIQWTKVKDLVTKMLISLKENTKEDIHQLLRMILQMEMKMYSDLRRIIV